MANLQITCHCGALSQTLTNVQKTESEIPLCHCYGCRHTTGQLFASYIKLPLTSLESVAGANKLTEYTAVAGGATRPTVKLYFCSTCGCHIFRSITSKSQNTIELASGTLVDSDGSRLDDSFTRFGPHVNVAETGDGGLAKWMTNIPTQSRETTPHYSQSDIVTSSASGHDADIHMASCLCKRVTFQVHAPTEASLSPHSHFADLIIPFHTQDPDIKNPSNVKWWMRKNNTRFMAGTCACKSCRLVSGFEIQSWAFVPRVNIMFATGDSNSDDDGQNSNTTWEILNFDKLHRNGTLIGYESSQGVLREFCPSCGATVFWHDTSRPELIDVSAGLLVPIASSGDSGEGVRVESLLEWWAERVSFAEDAVLGRKGDAERRARWLVESLQSNMRSK